MKPDAFFSLSLGVGALLLAAHHAFAAPPGAGRARLDPRGAAGTAIQVSASQISLLPVAVSRVYAIATETRSGMR